MSYGLMFHHFHGEGHPIVQGSISASDLEQIIEYIGPQNIVCAQEWAQLMREQKLAPHHCCLTFDDALKCQTDVALPVLEKYGLTGLWFISTSVFEGGNPLEIFRLFRTTNFEDIDDFYSVFFALAFKEMGISEQSIIENSDFENFLSEFVFYTSNDRKFRFLRDVLLGSEKYTALMWQLIKNYKVNIEALTLNLWLQPADVRILANNKHLIGLHSHNHPTDIASLNYERQFDEYKENADKITSITGSSPKIAAYPCNSYNNDSLKVLQSLGVELAFRSNMKDLNRRDMLEIPREDHTNIMAKIHA